MKRLLLFLTLLAAQGFAALVTVTGPWQDAQGNAAVGTCVISWPGFTSITGVSIAPSQKAGVAIAQGNIVALEPSGAGMYYTVTCTVGGRVQRPEYWVVPSSGPVEVKDVRRSVAPSPSLTVQRGQLPSQVAYTDVENIFTATGGLTAGNQSGIRLRELVANGSNYIEHKAPASLGSNSTFTWAAPSAGFFKSDSGGLISFVTLAFTDISGVATDAQIPNLNTLSTGLTASRCVETDGSGLLTSAAAVCGSGSGGLADPGGNGVVVRTALNTTTNRTITGTASVITVTNGDGVSGNPTLNVGANVASAAPTDDQVFVGSGSAWVGKAVPDCTDSGGNHINYTASTNAFSCGTSGSTSGNYQTVQDEGSSLTQRATINFAGAGVTCADSGGTKTTCTIPGGGGGLTQRISLLNTSVQPDASGNVFSELYPVKATNDFWKHAIWVFNDTATKDCLYGATLVPNDYSGSAAVKPFWTSTATTNNVVWEFAYRSITGDDTTSLDQATAVETLTVTDAAPTAANRRLVASMSATSANLLASDTLEWRFCRDGSSGSDTMTAAAMLFDLVLEYVTP